MPPVVVAAGIGAAAGIGGSILGSKAQKSAANKAADVSLQTAQMNNALSEKIYGENKQVLAPFVQSGANAVGKMNELLAQGPTGLTPINSQYLASMDPGSFEDYRESTGYDFRLNEGLDALSHGAAARGAYQSGAADKALVRFGQDFGSNEYQKWRANVGEYGQYADQFANQERAYVNDRNDNYTGLVANQQGLGLSAAAAQAGVGNTYVNNVSANNNSAGTAAANALLMKGAAQQNMYAGAANALGYGADQILKYKYGI
jgi:hypothetical protein